MKEFWYSGSTATGDIEGVIAARNTTDAHDRLRDSGISILHLKRIRPFSDTVFWDMLEMLGLFLRQGYNVTEALRLMAEDEHRKIQTAAPILRIRLESGISLNDCLQVSFRNLRPEWLAVLRVGEEAARLAETCALLIQRQQERRRQRRRMMSTIAYPLTVVVATLLVAWILFDSVLPNLDRSLQASTDLPGISRLVLSMSGQFGNMVERVIWVLVLILFPVAVAHRMPTLRPPIDKTLISIPGLRRILLGQARWQYFETLSLGLSGNLSIPKCLELAAGALDNHQLRKACASAQRRIEEGEPLSRALFDTGLVRRREFMQLDAAEKSGQLDTVIRTLCTDINERRQLTNMALAQVAGPISIIMIGGMIFLVAMAVVAPMMAMQAQLGDLAQ